MRILVLDPCQGDRHADLYVIDTAGCKPQTLRLGYVPELCFDRRNRQLLVVETELGKPGWAGTPTRYWLKCYDTERFRLVSCKETPLRPMYAGYPGRSTRVVPSPSGQHVYFLANRMVRREPIAESAYCMTAWRWDRQTDAIEPGRCEIESCLVAFGHMGAGDDDLFFHLSCDFPSTVAFANFHSDRIQWLRLEELPSRDHSPKETSGSWLDEKSGTLYAVNGEGTIYEVNRNPPAATVLGRLRLKEGQSVALHQLAGAADSLFVGVSADEGERSLSLASQVWRFSIEEGRLEEVLPMPGPVMNFIVTEDGENLVATSPYDKFVFVMETRTCRLTYVLPEIGQTPAEVLIVP